jgi:hypothetical protein
MKMAGTGVIFPSMPGAQRVLETSMGVATVHLKDSHPFPDLTPHSPFIIDSQAAKRFVY